MTQCIYNELSKRKQLRYNAETEAAIKEMNPCDTNPIYVGHVTGSVYFVSCAYAAVRGYFSHPDARSARVVGGRPLTHVVRRGEFPPWRLAEGYSNGGISP